jgi:hypothetical protein
MGIRALAVVDFPDPLSPVNQIQKPCPGRGNSFVIDLTDFLRAGIIGTFLFYLFFII